MATLYEYYITGDGNDTACKGDAWLCQTFTTDTAYTITSVKLKLYRYGTVGDVTVSIRECGEHYPTGEDLCVGTTNGNTLNNYPPHHQGIWREITLGGGSLLAGSTKYAIIVRALDDDGYLYWQNDNDNPTYADGAFGASYNAGVAWETYPPDGSETDGMFETWGEPAEVAPSVTTQACTDIAPESLTGNGVVTSLGNSTVTQHGHCWSTSQNPTTADTKTLKGTAYQTGHFTSAITGLTAGATYYIKAYATNTGGTAYGSQVSNTMATAIGRRYWWVEGRDFHWFGQDGVEYIAPGIGVASPDIPWPF